MYEELTPEHFEIADSKQLKNKLIHNTSGCVILGIAGTVGFLTTNYPAFLLFSGGYMVFHVYNSSLLRGVANNLNEQHEILTRFSNSRHYLDAGAAAARVQREKAKKRPLANKSRKHEGVQAPAGTRALTRSEEVHIQCEFGTILTDLFGLFQTSESGDLTNQTNPETGYRLG